MDSSMKPGVNKPNTEIATQKQDNTAIKRFKSLFQDAKKKLFKSNKSIDQRSIINKGATHEEIRKSISKINSVDDLNIFVTELATKTVAKAEKTRSRSFMEIFFTITTFVCMIAAIAALGVVIIVAPVFPILMAAAVGVLAFYIGPGLIRELTPKETKQQKLLTEAQAGGMLHKANIDRMAKGLISQCFSILTQGDKSENYDPKFCQQLAIKITDILDDKTFNDTLKQSFLEIEAMQERYLEGKSDDDTDFPKEYNACITALPSKVIDQFFNIMKKNMTEKEYKKIFKEFDTHKSTIVENSKTFIRDVFKDNIEVALSPKKTDKKSKERREKLIGSTIGALNNGYDKYNSGKKPGEALKKIS